MLCRGVCQDRHNKGEPNSVICTKGGSVGTEIVVPDLYGNGILCEIVLGFCRFFTDHIQMRLQADGWMVFFFRRTGFFDYYIIGGVLF